MTGILTKLFLLQAGMQMDWPEHRTRALELLEMAVEVPGEHRYLLHLKELDRSFHFLLEVDRSACQGPVLVNAQPVTGNDLAESFRFDQANEVRITGCLERTPAPLRVLAVPRVYVAAVRLQRQDARGYELEIEVRNTLPNSLTCSLEAGDGEEQFLLGAQTSQTRSLFVRLRAVKGRELEVRLWKFAEPYEGSYQHVMGIRLPKQP
jgi:hypothetical protein